MLTQVQDDALTLHPQLFILSHFHSIPVSAWVQPFGHRSVHSGLGFGVGATACLRFCCRNSRVNCIEHTSIYAIHFLIHVDYILLSLWRVMTSSKCSINFTGITDSFTEIIIELTCYSRWMSLPWPKFWFNWNYLGRWGISGMLTKQVTKMSQLLGLN